MKNSFLKWTAFLGVLLLLVLLVVLSGRGNTGEEVSLRGGGTSSGTKSVAYLIENELVTDIYISGGSGKIKVKGSTVKDFPKNADYSFTYSMNADVEYLGALIDEYNRRVALNPIDPDYLSGPEINYTSVAPSESIFSTLLPWISIAILLVLGFFIIRSIMGANSKSMNFGRTKVHMAQNVKVRFTDVAGIDEEKEELEEVVEFLKNPGKFTELGAKIPKGILLVGQPGTGKTLLAKAIAGESSVPFFSISGSDFVEMFVGVGASRVRDLFEQAKRSAPCLVFIDEIDAVGRQRGAGLGGGNDEREQTLNQLLVQMDGFEGNEGIIIIAATNRSDVLDPALLRPGRFDRQIYVYPPDVKGREKIFEVHSKNKPLASDVNFKTLSRITSGFTGADIENVLNEAAIIAAKQGHKKLTMKDITEGINKVIMGPQKKSRVITDNDKKITAYHEAGHAIVHKLLPNCDNVQEVSIIPRGMAAGYTYSRPETDDMHISKSKFLDELCGFYGGRVAEELIIGDISAGASNDIERATAIARRMVTEFGMSELGAVNFQSSSGEVFIGRNYQTQVTYSEQRAYEIDLQISKILKECYDKTVKLLKANLDKIHTMAEILLEKETIYSEEVDLIMQGKSKAAVIKVMNENEERTKTHLELERAENDLNKITKEQATKVKTAEALLKAGVITQKELLTLKTEGDTLIAAAQEKYQTLKAKAETKKEVKTDNTNADNKTENIKTDSKKPVKKFPSKTNGSAKTNADKTPENSKDNSSNKTDGSDDGSTTA